MQQIATVWLVFRLSQSSLLLGVADCVGQLPAALILPLAGVLTDRWQRHRTVLVTQSLMMLQAFALMTLTVTGAVSIWQILVLSALLGVVNAFDCTARQSFVIDMVDGHHDLDNAIAINSSVFNAARLLGPAVAGIVIGLCGEWPCFCLNGLSYLAVLASLLAMRVRPNWRRTGDAGLVEGLREGFGYIARSMPIRTILILLGIVSMMSAPLTVLMPLLATRVLHGGPYTLGLLTAALGAGALGGSLFLAARKSVIGLGPVIAAATAVFGLGLTAIACSGSLPLSLAVLACTGFAMVAQMAASNSLLQSIVEEAKRGRVMSFYTLAFFGMGPLGSLLSGEMASSLGIVPTFVTFGAVCSGAAAVFTAILPDFRRAIKPMYIRAGILREASEAVPAVRAPSRPAGNTRCRWSHRARTRPSGAARLPDCS